MKNKQELKDEIILQYQRDIERFEAEKAQAKSNYDKTIGSLDERIETVKLCLQGIKII